MNKSNFNIIMPESSERVLCVKIDKPISADGYENNFMPRVRKMIDTYGEARLLIYYENYQGWEDGAAKHDVEAAVQYRDKLAKLALVNPPEKEMLQKKIKQRFMTGELRFFASEDLQIALKWVEE